MAIKEICSNYFPSVGKQYKIYEMSSVSDKSYLPTSIAPTSVAIIVKVGMPTWMLNSNGEWKPINAAAEDEEP